MLHSKFSIHRGFVRFHGRHPLFTAAMVAVISVAVAGQSLILGITAVLLLGLAGGIFIGWRTGFAWLLCGCIAAGGFLYRRNSLESAKLTLLKSGASEMRGKVLEDANGSRFWSAPVILESGPQVGAKVWWKGMGEIPVAGAEVKGRGNFVPLPLPRNPGEFDQAAWMRSKGITAVFEATLSRTEVKTGRLARFGNRVRQSFRTAVTAGLDEESQQARVIRAIVIGEQPHDSDVLVAAFRNSGTLHAFSVSGLHVAMVGSIAWLLLRLAGVPRRWAVLVLLPLIFSYAWVTGDNAPAVRSAWMAAVFLGAFVFRRRPDLLNALGTVLLTAMLIDGRLLFQPGVQLSYGVVAAISIGVSWTSRLFTWMAKPELYLPLALMTRRQTWWLNFRRYISQALGVSLAAGMGSAPLTAVHFGLVTPISVVAGVVLIPLVFVLLCAALFTAALYPVYHPAAKFAATVNSKVADLCVMTAAGFASVPGGHFQIRQMHQPFLIVYDLERGSGAACFSSGNGNGVLLDCAGIYTFKHQLLPSLRRLGVTPDSVILSHPDGDHLGGGSAVWEAFPIRQVILPVELSRSPAFHAWLNDAPKAGIKTTQAANLRSIPLPDGARLEVIQTPDPLARSTIADERVVIFRLHWQGWKILLTSDAGVATELALLRSGKDITADVIIAGHHSSEPGLTDALIAAVHPQAIIASNAPFPLAERLDPSRTAYWRSEGITVFDQGRSGGVTLTIDASGSLRIGGFVDHSIALFKPR